jgi:hypothetical protein
MAITEKILRVCSFKLELPRVHYRAAMVGGDLAKRPRYERYELVINS